LQHLPVVPHCTAGAEVVQQSATVWQAVPSGAQAQRPLVHTLLQHSPGSAHTVPIVLQHVRALLHCIPPQQSSTEVHAPRAGTQQSVPSQVRPVQQSACAEHGRFTASQQRPSEPHVAPKQHGVAALQAVPRAAQQRLPSQLPLQHSTALVHCAPGARQGPQREPVQIELPQQLA
jgi:hypothetical protein